MSNTISTLSDYIEEISEVLIQLAKGDLTKDFHEITDFLGDFASIKESFVYLVCFDCDRDMAIHDLEQRLHQGKLSFASPERMARYLGLEPGSVSPFGLINDEEHHVHLFLDCNLQKAESVSFHPNDSRGTVVVPREEFMRYLDAVGNSWEFIELY